jgi:hypothetical protein
VTLADTRTPLLAQGAYYVGTGVAPFLSRRAFEAVTGPKREWWLVQTVGALVTVQGAGLLVAAARRRQTPELVATGAGVALALGAIDVVFVARRRIAPTYLGDAAVQTAIMWALARALRRAGDAPSAPLAADPSHPRP